MTTSPTPAEQLRDGNGVGTWTLDPAASSITTATKHFWGLITVRGTFTDASGHATVTPQGSVSAELVIDAASIDTKNKKRDEHLRSDDFFDTDQHPTIRFATNDVTVTGATTARVTGTLTAGGSEQAVSFEATVTAQGDRATVTAGTEIDHKALGMTWSPAGMAKPTTHVALALTFVRH